MKPKPLPIKAGSLVRLIEPITTNNDMRVGDVYLVRSLWQNNIAVAGYGGWHAQLCFERVRKKRCAHLARPLCVCLNPEPPRAAREEPEGWTEDDAPFNESF